MNLKKSLVKVNIKNLALASVLYGVLIFFVATFNILIGEIDLTPSYNYFYQILAMRNEMLILLYTIVPFAFSVFLFRFLHIENASTKIGSLPYKRKEIYNSYIMSGVILLTTPIIVNALLMFTKGLYYKEILIWILFSTLANIAIFTFGSMMATVTGMTSIQVPVGYIVLILPAFLYRVISASFEMLVYGFTVTTNQADKVLNISPLTNAFSLNLYERNYRSLEFILNKSEFINNIFRYSIYIILFYIMGLLFFKNRKMEKVEEPIAFDFLKVIFKYGVAFCTSILSGIFLYETIKGTTENINFYYLGIFIGGIIGYYIAEVILNKTFNVVSKMKGVLKYLIIIFIIIIGIEFDVTGYERKIPEIENIESIEYDNNRGGYQYIIDGELVNTEFTKKDTIKGFIELHKELLKLKSSDSDKKYTVKYFKYNLENGKRIIRKYRFERPLVEDKIKEIYKIESYKIEKYKFLFNLTENKIYDLNLRNNTRNSFDNISLNIKSDYVSFIDSLQKDYLKMNYEDFNEKDKIGYLEVFYKVKEDIKTHRIYIYESNINTVELLKEKNLYEKINFDVNEIEKITREKEMDEKNYIEDKKLIEKIYEKSFFEHGYKENYYMLRAQNKENENITFYIYKEDYENIIKKASLKN